MSKPCHTCFKGYKIEIINCSLILTTTESTHVNCVQCYDIKESNQSVTFTHCDGTIETIFFNNNVNFDTWQSFKDYINNGLVGCCSGAQPIEPEVSPEDYFQSIETIERCHKVTCEKVAIEKCKNSLGVIVYRLEGVDGDIDIADYEICGEQDFKHDLKEYGVLIPENGNEINIIPLDGYDALIIENKSLCPLLVKLTLAQKSGTPIIRKVKLSPKQTRTFDWETDVISNVSVGQCPVLAGGITEIDLLNCIPATQDIEVLVTLFNS